jgi:FkbM family methyltransferase
MIQLPDELQARATILNNVALRIAADNRRATGITMMRRAIATNPFDHKYRTNLAMYLATSGEVTEARKLIDIVLRETPNSSNAWNVLAFCTTLDGDLEGAIACNMRALEHAPDSGKFKFDLGASYLRAGDFERGWPLYEFRTEVDNLPPPPPLPRWDGKSRCRHLFVYGEQGIGDKIQFGRFLPWARQHCDKLTFAVDPDSLPLFYGYRRVCELTTALQVGDCDAQISLASLPFLYGVNAENIPPDPGLIELPPTQGALLAKGLKIGIVWAGNARQVNDDTRSMSFTDMLVLANDPRSDLFSLQVGPRAAEIAENRAQLIVNDMSGIIEGNWSATPSLIASMDLVVTVCTSVAHLAGALGIPTILVLSRFSCWRWMWDRTDTPWYPSIKIVRQEKLHDWKTPMRQVAAMVSGLHAQRAIARERIVVEPKPQVPTVYEPDVTAAMQRILRPGDCFVDVGANVGRHTCEAARLVGEEGRVIAIEPGTNCLPQLREAAGGFSQVTIIDKPAWNHAGEVTFFLNADSPDGNALWDPGDWPGPHNPKSKDIKQPNTMTAVRLDDVIDTSPRLIKIDTEGAEQRVLEGAARHLHPQTTPFIIAELHEFGLEKLGCSQESLRSFMESRGYSTFTMYMDGSVPSLVPPGTRIHTGYIFNLLFATPQAVSEVWQILNVHNPAIRPMMYVYGMPPEAAA